MSIKASVEYTEAVNGLRADVRNLKVLVDEEMEQAFFDIGAILKLQVENALPRSEKTEDVRKGTRKTHVHLKDDVKYWVGIAKSSGQRYVSVFGGKFTGYKWGWINDGHLDEDRNQIQGIHFLEKALGRAEGMIDETIDEYLQDAVTHE